MAGALLAVAAVAALVPAGLRWLRVAQREHYLAPATSLFAVRWWRVDVLNGALFLVAVAALGLAAVYLRSNVARRQVFAYTDDRVVAARTMTRVRSWRQAPERSSGPRDLVDARP